MDHIEKEIKVAGVITRKLLVGEEISEQEEAALRGWLEESERHRAWFREYREKLPLGEFEEVVQISDVKEQWQKLDQLTKERKHIGWRKCLCRGSCFVAVCWTLVGNTTGKGGRACYENGRN